MKVCAAVLILAVAASAQTAPEFAVASVKPSASDADSIASLKNFVSSPGTVTMSGVTLHDAIEWAYHLQRCRVAGPEWLAASHFDIAAKAPSPVPVEQLRLMFQKLLADRFHLAVHREVQERRVYVLLISRAGHKLRQSAAEGDAAFGEGNEMQGVSMDQLADILSHFLDVPVLDQTRLQGRFDFSLSMLARLPTEGVELDMPSALSWGLEQQVGLRIEARKSPVEMLVVDRADRVPVGN